MTRQDRQPDQAVTELNKLFVKALRAMNEAGRHEEACQLAGQGWSRLRHAAPGEAERLNGLLHYLTAPSKKPTQQPGETGKVTP